MGKTSNTSSQIITLPKGGGALHGIGEKFAPDLHTGTGNFTVPIALPAGRNGFQPQLNLVYSTGTGNGLFGLGWSLSVPGVSRKTSKGIPHYHNYDTYDTMERADVFILSGAEDLVPVGQPAPGITRYRPRTEGLFAHIDHHHSGSDDYWEVRSKDGLVSIYGAPGSLGASDPAAIARNDRQKYAWKLTETRDSFGNRIAYSYRADEGTEGPHTWRQPLLSRIEYADIVEGNATRFLISVSFDYEDRLDPSSDYRAGFEIRTTQRCRAITIETHFDRTRQLRTYAFTYDNGAANGVSLLTKIDLIGYDDAGQPVQELPPLAFGYTHFDPIRAKKCDLIPVTGADLPPSNLGRPEYELADLTGDGLPDVLEINGVVRYWRNLGGGQFDLPRTMQEAPAGLMLADPGVQLIDADGDGRVDLLASTNGMAGYFPLEFNGQWDRRSFQRHHLAPSFSLEDPEVKLIDLDGDGVTDAIRSGSRLECFFNDPKQGWRETHFVERRTGEGFPATFADPRVKWADMTGDGLQDIVLVYDGDVEYWPNLGYGDWGQRIHMLQSPRFPYGYDPRRILVGDVDGDGAADIVYVDDTKVMLWINRSGNAWSDRITIQGTPPVTDMDSMRLVDLLGSGIAGVLWSADAGGSARAHMYFLDFTAGIKPYLLSEMDNHLGAVTKVGYAPSTRFYLEDQQKRSTRWQTPLPFPVHVVARVEAIDHISGGKLTSEYSYHHGYWDGAEREFRGFGRVEQLDTETFAAYGQSGLHGKAVDFAPVARAHFSPPTLTKTWFHLGPVGETFGDWDEIDFEAEFWPSDAQMLGHRESSKVFLAQFPQTPNGRRIKRDALRALRGNILRSELYALDDSPRAARPYTVTESAFGLREESAPDAGDDRQRIFFPYLTAQRITQWERGDDPQTSFSFMVSPHTAITESYDAYGQPLRQTQIACPRYWRALGDRPVDTGTTEHERRFLATRTLTSYAQRDDDHIYMVDRVANTATYEIRNSGDTKIQVLRDLLDDDASLQLIGQTLHYYDGEAFEGLDQGQLGDFGALVRTETLILTEEILRQAYRSGKTVLDPPEMPPYLVPDGALVPWPVEYPQAFREQLAALPGLAGYTFYPSDHQYEPRYFTNTLRQRYDFQEPAGHGHGLVTASRDPLGGAGPSPAARDTAIAYDDFGLLPVAVTNPARLTTQASYDYRVLQPNLVTDPNGNRTIYSFSPLGLLSSIAVMGKAGEDAGDTAARPGTRLEYDFSAFQARGQPASVRTIRRVHHAHDTAVPLAEQDQTIETVEYSDGFGRMLQTRTQAEELLFGDPVSGDALLPVDLALAPGEAMGRQHNEDDPPNVIVSGWQTYNNKGQVVEKYEPFFSAVWAYRSPEAERDLFQREVLGQKATLFYDPRGHVIRTINPDRSEQRVIYGVPNSLDDPDHYAPNPWVVYTYDADDNAGRTHPDEAWAYDHCWNTPASIVTDALGRTITAIERNRLARPLPNDHLPDSEQCETHFTYDIRGNPLTVTDALGRSAFTYVYDLANQPLRTANIDAGIRRIVLDAAGNEVERRDSKSALVLLAYDTSNRLTQLWARDDLAGAVTLRERLEYGDGGDQQQREASRLANRLGRLHWHYDEAGLLTVATYDFKGNILEKSRQVIGDAAIRAVFESPPPDWHILAFRVDWQPAGITLEDQAASLLDPTLYETSIGYDALNRVMTMRYPQDVNGRRWELRPRYNRAGALEAVALDGATYVEHIAYNAKGQRTLIAYGNGVLTRYAYDPRSFRLARLRTERYLATDAHTYRPTGAALQDFAYAYDLAGNILALHDRTPGSGIPNSLVGSDALDQSFTYDALYRLISATGRECDLPPPPPPWEDRPRCADLTRTRGYKEQYTYDRLGNLGQLQHQTNGSIVTREFTLVLTENSPVPQNNRLATMAIGQTIYACAYDDSGNLLQEHTSRHFEWDYADRMRVYRTQPGNAEPSVHAHYLYDASGQRVKKLVRKQGGDVETTIYIDGIFEHHHWGGNGMGASENNRLHVMDDKQRIALVRAGPRHPNDQGPAMQYHLGDHLGSNNVVIDDTGAWINREEYTPYGETSFGSFARKRYRFTGKERDEESGLYYHGARYYAPWLGRWTSCDPVKTVNRSSLYTYVQDHPTVMVDPTGKEGVLSRLVEVARGYAEEGLEENLTGVAMMVVDPLGMIATADSVSKAYVRGTREGGQLAGVGAMIHETNPLYQGIVRPLMRAGSAGVGAVQSFVRGEDREAGRQLRRHVSSEVQVASNLFSIAGPAVGLGGSRTDIPSTSSPITPSIPAEPRSNPAPSLPGRNVLPLSAQLALASEPALQVLSDTGSRSAAGTALHNYIGAAPHGPDLLLHKALLVEVKSTYGQGIPRRILRQAERQNLNYAQQHAAQTQGRFPIRMEIAINPKTGQKQRSH